MLNWPNLIVVQESWRCFCDMAKSPSEVLSDSKYSNSVFRELISLQNA